MSERCQCGKIIYTYSQARALLNASRKRVGYGDNRRRQGWLNLKRVYRCEFQHWHVTSKE